MKCKCHNEECANIVNQECCLTHCKNKQLKPSEFCVSCSSGFEEIMRKYFEENPSCQFCNVSEYGFDFEKNLFDCQTCEKRWFLPNKYLEKNEMVIK